MAITDWSRICKCGRIMQYSSYRAFWSANRRGSLCAVCARAFTPIILYCSLCRCEIQYTSASGYSRALNNISRKCEACSKRYYASTNPEKVRAAKSKWNRANTSYQTAYWRDNKERLVAYREKWRFDNSEAVSAKCRQISSTRRSKQRLGDASSEFIKNLIRSSHNCPLCGVAMNTIKLDPASKHVDHIIPLCCGGLHNMDNLRTICRKCNISRPRKNYENTLHD